MFLVAMIAIILAGMGLFGVSCLLIYCVSYLATKIEYAFKAFKVSRKIVQIKAKAKKQSLQN